MLLAEGGVPSLTLVAATLVGGALAAGSANTLNCYLDRDIDQVMHRTERRPLATGLVEPARGARLRRRPRCRRGRLARGDDRLAARRARFRGDRVLRGRLHDGPQAAHPAEHRVGRRCRLHAGADRLVGRHRLAVLGAGRALRGHLLLDAPALLAAVDAVPRRLRGGRGADAAGRRGQRHGGPADRGLQLGDGGHLAAAVAGGRHRLRSTALPPCCSAPRSSARPTCCCAGPAPRPRGICRPGRRSRPAPCGSSTARSPTSPCCSSPSRSTRCCPSTPLRRRAESHRHPGAAAGRPADPQVAAGRSSRPPGDVQPQPGRAGPAHASVQHVVVGEPRPLVGDHQQRATLRVRGQGDVQVGAVRRVREHVAEQRVQGGLQVRRPGPHRARARSAPTP